MKKLQTIAILAAAISMLAVGCTSKKNDNNKKLALLYLAEQASGNCATIQKTNTSGVVYTATATGVPMGGCNASTLDKNLYVTDAATAVTYWQNFFTILNTQYSNYTSCSTAATYANTYKSSLPTTANLTSSTYTSSNYNCHTGQLLNGATSSSGSIQTMVYCPSASDEAAYKASISYLGVSDATVDMSTNITYIKAEYNLSSNAYGFSTTAVNSARVISVAELTTLADSGNVYAALQLAYALNSSSATCGTAILADSKNSTLKSLLLSEYGASTTGQQYGFSSSDASGVSAVVMYGAYQPTCKYGAGFTETASANKVTVGSSSMTQYGTCPSTYGEF